MHIITERSSLLSFYCIMALALTFYVVDQGMYVLLSIPVGTCFLGALIFFPRVVFPLYFASFYFGTPLYMRLLLGVDLSDIFFVILIFAYFSGYLSKRSTSSQIESSGMPLYGKKILAVLVIFLLWSILSFFLNIISHESINQLTSLFYLIRLIQMTIAFLVFLDSYWEGKADLLINTILICSSLQLLIGLYQFLGIRDNYEIRAVKGTFFHHAAYGNVMLVSLALSVYRLLTVRKNKLRVSYGLLSTAFLYVIVASGSRSTLLGIMACGVIIFLTNFKIRLVHLGYAALSVLLVLVILHFTPLQKIVTDTFVSPQTSSIDMSGYGRALIWKGALLHFDQAPILQKVWGVGMGTYMSVRYPFFLDHERYTSGAHNNFIHVLIETGIGGLIIFLFLYYKILAILKAGKGDKVLSMALFYLTIALLLTGITQETFWFQPAMCSFWLFYMSVIGVLMHSTTRGEMAVGAERGNVNKKEVLR